MTQNNNEVLWQDRTNILFSALTGQTVNNGDVLSWTLTLLMVITIAALAS